MKQTPPNRPRAKLLDLATIGFVLVAIAALGYFAFQEIFGVSARPDTAGLHDLTSSAIIGPPGPTAAHHRAEDAITPMPQVVVLPGIELPKTASLGKAQRQAMVLPQLISLPGGGSPNPHRASLGAVAAVPTQIRLQQATPLFAAAALPPGPGGPTVLTVGDPKPAGEVPLLWGRNTPAEVAGTFSGADRSLVDWLSALQQRMARLDRDQAPYLGDLESALGRSRLTDALGVNSGLTDALGVNSGHLTLSSRNVQCHALTPGPVPRARRSHFVGWIITRIETLGGGCLRNFESLSFFSRGGGPASKR